MRLTVRGGHPTRQRIARWPPMHYWLMKSEPERVLDRRPRRGARARPSVVRRAQLPGAQLHADDMQRRRRRAVLSLVVPGAGHRRHRRSGERAVSRRHAVRPEEPLLRPQVEARRRRAGATSTSSCARRRACCRLPRCARRPRWPHDRAAPRQPALDHAGDRRGVARGAGAPGHRDDLRPGVAADRRTAGCSAASPASSPGCSASAAA